MRSRTETPRNSAAPEDAGAAGGVTNVAHQPGGSLGLGLLVAVFAAADSTTLRGSELLAHRIGTSLTVGAGRVRRMALAGARAGKSGRA